MKFFGGERSYPYESILLVNVVINEKFFPSFFVDQATEKLALRITFIRETHYGIEDYFVCIKFQKIGGYIKYL